MHVYPKNDSLKVVIVEDHADLRELFVGFLCGMGHTVAGFSCADEFDEYLAGQTTDLLILDLNLPGEDGYSIASRLRAAHPELHILMLTARSALEDRIQGYVCGADNYLTKPISPPELGIVVDSIVRRVKVRRNQQIDVHLDTLRQHLAGPAGGLSLTTPEVRLLKALAEAPDGKLDYWRLQELLQLEPDDKGKAALEVRISRLKKKLHEAGAPEPAIKSLWKEGYQLCVPVRL
jgi:DNA-binding response OmpR family regulator